MFQWDLTSDRLVDFQESVTVEHTQINERCGRRSHYKLEHEGGNDNYNDLSCTDVTITDTHFLIQGRENTIVQVPPPQQKRRRGKEANDPKKTDYTRIWGITRWPTDRRIKNTDRRFRTERR